jgi:hypothetical protein
MLSETAKLALTVEEELRRVSYCQALWYREEAAETEDCSCWDKMAAEKVEKAEKMSRKRSH